MSKQDLCEHLDAARDREPNTPAGCEECLRLGDTWVKARLCLTCGQVGCCDSSKNQHARKHYLSSDHPVIGSFEPGEHWRWCYPDKSYARLSARKRPRLR